MYGPIALIGVASAVVAEQYSTTSPRPRLALMIGVLTFTGMMTHVSMGLLAVGLVCLVVLRRDTDTWRWRAAVAAAASAWALVWGMSSSSRAEAAIRRGYRTRHQLVSSTR